MHFALITLVLVSQGTPAKRDPLLGKWVCIADNGGGFKTATLTFKSDGTATFKLKGKSHIRKYKREPGKAWAARRQTQIDFPGQGDHWKEYSRPGVEMVYFKDSKEGYVDYGGNLLQLEPKIPLLYNFMTQAWCRPGDEKRVKKLISP